MAKLIILRGNSGSGKTTTGKALQRKFGHDTMLISQDVVRRDILFAKDGPNPKAGELILELSLYGKNHCNIAILEGILNSKW
ncbi:AAA family ATPase [Clostridium diolis]|uniref:AAA family ATPase n=1 Tax=Clostridium diolis TaxID=223919 RepID=UPI001FA86A78|nr:AAA family ATPase [Clostridium diolis]